LVGGDDARKSFIGKKEVPVIDTLRSVSIYWGFLYYGM
jgi:hypothetical protein